MQKYSPGVLLSFLFLFSISFFIFAPSNPSFAEHTVIVSTPQGTAVPGCETTHECYIPNEVTVDVGGTVTWSNDDSAAHTVTSGSAADGPSGVFDSSLFMAGTTFSHTFVNEGEFPYFCMVHPWMEGIVTVQSEGKNPPTLKYDIRPSAVKVGDKVFFDASESSDSDGTIVKYEWWFGDGGYATGNIRTHEYSSPGDRTVVLKITDNDNLKTTKNIFLKVSPAPKNEETKTCGEGTKLVNGECQIIKTNGEKINTPDYWLWVVVGIVIAAGAGGAGFAISRSRKSSTSETITTTVSDSSSSKKGRECNVCGTIIPEGKNVCPNCGDTYS